jgi:hypothetical protein
MLLSNYANANLLCNISFNSKTSRANEYVYRGDLVLEEGEIADAQGRRKPPVSVIRQAIVLASDSKISVLIGAVHELALLDLAMERYAKDFDDTVKLVFFVENINRPLKTTLQKFPAVLLPIVDTAVWSEIIEEVHLEKDDFKGQSVEDKIVTLKGALDDYNPKYESVDFATAKTRTVQVKHAGRGAV